ncbi:MAG TPA: MarR family transcriptional regulator [Chloroflexota bacterium]|nr:MarR family transcriptional regulator [Chloroflexota bacterium]
MPSLAVLDWLRLARVYQKVDRASVCNLRQYGLSVAQFDILARVGHAEGLSQQELADALLVTKGNICQLLDRMAETGLIVRRQEGRANHLFLTPAGRALYEKVLPEQEALVERLFGALAPAQQAELLALLRQVERGLE